MSEFVPELLRLVQAAIRECEHLANVQTPTSILPLRKSPPSERLPWEPGSIELTPDERQLLAWLWRELNQELGSEEEISESDVLYFALQELQLKVRDSNREEMLLRLEFHLRNLRQ
jgi:DNA-binding response OmpR family regulator